MKIEHTPLGVVLNFETKRIPIYDSNRTLIDDSAAKHIADDSNNTIRRQNA